MPNPDNLPQLPKNQSAISTNGVVSRDWYRFFLNLLNKVNEGGGGGNGTGTVTSVAVSGGSTGLTTTGGPITTNGTIVLSGTVNVSNGGTGASTAANARTNLSVPSLTGSGASGTWGINVTGTAANVSGVVAIANGGTGASTASGARANLVAAQSGANTDITSVTLTSGTITTSPSSSNDIVNKSYVDAIASGVNFHQACNYATTAALAANTYNNGSSGVGATLTANANGTLTIDGYTFVSGDVGKRILVKDESAGANNGIYTLTQAGTVSLPYILTRATDFDSAGTGVDQIDQGDLMLVISGTTNSNTSWVQQTPLPITVGTTALVFIEFAATQTYTAGTGLTLTTNQFSIGNIGTAGTYGSASAVPVLTTNAQGQVTSVTNTAIAISGSAVSGNISGSAGNVTGVVGVANGGTGLSSTPANGELDIGDGVGFTRARLSAGLNVLIVNTPGCISISVPNAGIAALTVTSPVASSGGTAPNISLASGYGDIQNPYASKTANFFLAAPNGTAGVPTFRAVVAADIPTLNQNTTGNAGTVTNGVYTTGSYADPTWITSLAGSKITGNISGSAGNVTGVVAIANGGTGQTTAVAAFDALSPATTKGDLIVSNGTDNVRQAVGTDTFVLTANSSAATGVSWLPSSGSGATITNDTTTATDLYPTFVAATSGSLTTIYTGNTKLLYKPSTGELTSPEVVASNGMFVNNQTISANYTIPAGSTAISGGPITVASGIAVTVSSGARWVTV
jgi:hypothetical protein